MRTATFDVGPHSLSSKDRILHFMETMDPFLAESAGRHEPTIIFGFSNNQTAAYMTDKEKTLVEFVDRVAEEVAERELEVVWHIFLVPVELMGKQVSMVSSQSQKDEEDKTYVMLSSKSEDKDFFKAVMEEDGKDEEIGSALKETADDIMDLFRASFLRDRVNRLAKSVRPKGTIH